MDPLLHLLQKNALTPTEELGRLLNMSAREVEERKKKLEEEQVILGYQAVVNREQAGSNSVTAVIEVRITPERGGGFDRLARRIAKFDQVQSCYLMSGGYDLLVMVEGQNLREVAQFVSEKLSSLEGVLSTATLFHLKTYKESGMMVDREEQPERLQVSP